MKIDFFPKTVPGRRSVSFALLFAALAVVVKVISNFQDNVPELPNPLNSPLLGTALYLTFIAAAIAFVYGVKAFFRNEERAILLYLVLLVCGYWSFAALGMLVFCVIEILF